MAHSVESIKKELSRLNQEIMNIKLEIAPVKEELQQSIVSEDKDLTLTLRKTLADLDKKKDKLKSDWYLMHAELMEMESKNATK